ncbi:DUF5966 family protein, partial [Streptococcus suis]
YLFFTERYLYVEDLATNGILSFTALYIIFSVDIEHPKSHLTLGQYK